MEFRLPKSWGELTQQQLRKAIRIMSMFDGMPFSTICMQAMMYFLDVEVDRRTDAGFLCKERPTGKVFILDPGLLPSMAEEMAWMEHPEEMTLRIEQWDGHKAVDFELQELPFGEYLVTENYYQAFLMTHDGKHLNAMARILYRVPEDAAPKEDEEVMLGVFLWMTAVKRLLAERFPNYLRPASGTDTSAGSMQDATLAQIRLLTGGDVTKNDYVLKKTDTWTALAELDAKAREAEEIRRKYGK